jgi:penicillin G amidase
MPASAPPAPDATPPQDRTPRGRPRDSGRGRPPFRAARAIRWVLLAIAGAGVVAGTLVVGYGEWLLHVSRPVLTGTLAVPGLSAPVTITRDGDGVPTLVARNRLDLARALGFLHGQERFFEMDLLRRTGDGSLAALVGPAALPLDRLHRLHRFRTRAQAVLMRQDPVDRATLAAYAAGVNAGRAALGHDPFEYTLLRVAPAPWTDLDSLLVVYAMYFDLQSADGAGQRLHAALRQEWGPGMASFLDPHLTPLDAPADESADAAPPAMPATLGRRPPAAPGAAAPGPGGAAPTTATATPPPPERGSNNIAVSGRLTGTGAAMVANDMHLGLTVPNIWYRARQVIRPEPVPPDDPFRTTPNAAPHIPPAPLDLTGVTLPGEPYQIVGTNTRVAWTFTDSFIETGDMITLDVPPDATDLYRAPDGLHVFETAHETLCAAHETCHGQDIVTTIWGPVSGRDADGRPQVWRWSAEDDNAIDYRGFRALESATGVRAALDAAHRTGLPQENMLVGDRDGHIGWTVIGPVPRRVGLDDQMPHSWADGQHGWDGYLPAAEIPELVDPPSGRLWSANGRVVGGSALALLGDGGYADGLRAGRIRDDLFARDRFTELDLLAIETDDHATVLRPWQALLAAAIAARPNRPDIAAMGPYVADWGEHARPDSVGYRLVHGFRAHALAILFGAYAHPLPAVVRQAGPDINPGTATSGTSPSGSTPPGPTDPGPDTPPPAPPRMPARAAWAIELLLTQRPPGLLPPPWHDWDQVTDAILDALAGDVRAAGGLARFPWGAVNHVGIHHPLTRALPLLGRLTDPPDTPEAGDTMLPRVAIPGFGASERLVVSPGHEDTALFDMPMGQAANPLAPYYASGQEAWVNGNAYPLRPGSTRWTLTLTP